MSTKQPQLPRVTDPSLVFLLREVRRAFLRIAWAIEQVIAVDA